MQLNSRHWRNRAEEARLLAETMTRHWRNRAKEARLLAETMSDTEARQTMLAIADLYQKMAKIAERSEVIPKRTNGPSDEQALALEAEAEGLRQRLDGRGGQLC
jgi:hypothetical protein